MPNLWGGVSVASASMAALFVTSSPSIRVRSCRSTARYRSRAGSRGRFGTDRTGRRGTRCRRCTPRAPGAGAGVSECVARQERNFPGTFSYRARPMHRVAADLADGLVAELPAPSFLAVALQGPLAGAVGASGQHHAGGAVVALPTDVAAGRGQ